MTLNRNSYVRSIKNIQIGALCHRQMFLNDYLVINRLNSIISQSTGTIQVANSEDYIDLATNRRKICHVKKSYPDGVREQSYELISNHDSERTLLNAYLLINIHELTHQI